MDSSRHEQHRHQAFTLIELLVVVSLISLLISILLPSLGKTTAKGRAAVCQSNLKALGEAYYQYALSNVKRLVGGETGAQSFDWVGGGNSENSITSHNGGEFFNYVSSIDAYRCPDHVYPNYLRSYSIIGHLNGQQKDDGVTVKKHWTSNMVHAKQLVFIEEDDYRGSNLSSFVMGSADGAFIDMVAANHESGDNLGFMDGHVEYWEWQSTAMRTRPKFSPSPVHGYTEAGNPDHARLKEVFRTWSDW